MMKNKVNVQTKLDSLNNLTDFQGGVLLSEAERTRTEVWTRVMGYHRPISAFNPGKKSEHAERLHFKENVSTVCH
jgi:hypothetical protein